MPAVKMKNSSKDNTSTVPLPKKIEVTLPTKPSPIETDISRFSYFIYGHQKIGKTSFTTQFEKPFHIMFEPGAKAYEVYEVHPENWKEFVAYVDLLCDEKGTQFKTVVIDPVDILWEFCAEQICKDAVVDMLKDIGFGDGYERCSIAFRKQMIRLHQKYGLICISHAKDKKLEKVSGKQFNQIDYTHPSCAGRCAQVLGKWCDLTGYYYIGRDLKRYLRIQSSADIEAGNRMKGLFCYKDGTPIQDVPMGSSEEQAYKSFLNAFNNTLEKTEKQKPKTIKLKGENHG